MRLPRRLSPSLLLGLACFALAACSNLSHRMGEAAGTAARDPLTWAPLAAAAVIAGSDSDERLSRWARSETPLFGTRDAALAASDRFREYASIGAWGIFAAATPRGDNGWMVEKAMDGGGNLVGLAAARNFTGNLKVMAHRERPRGGPVHDSLPSAHSSDAFAHAAMGRFYADDLRVSPTGRLATKAAMDAFAAATAWARVEGGVHYPVDVLVGAAVANFTTRLILELNAPDAVSGWRVRPWLGNGEILVQFGRSF